MYGKLFNSMYDGTLVADWRALVTFQQMIILCDADGTIDMTPFALSQRTGIPIEHIEAGIKILEAPDPQSRTPNDEGMRITRMDEHRAWGWSIVNHHKYKMMASAEDRREQNRLNKQAERERRQESASVSVRQRVSASVSDGHQPSAMSAHTDTDTYTDTDLKPKPLRAEARKTQIEILTKTFDQFWQHWPQGRKRAKVDAWKAWQAIKFHLIKPDEIMAALEIVKKTDDWIKEKGKFIPLPASWIRGQRWQDEGLVAQTAATKANGGNGGSAHNPGILTCTYQDPSTGDECGMPNAFRSEWHGTRPICAHHERVIQESGRATRVDGMQPATLAIPAFLRRGDD